MIMTTDSIKKLIKEKKIITPAYLLDLSVLDEHMKKIDEICHGTVDLCYAMKAEYVHRIEVCSPGELEICRFHEIPGEDIVFSGVNKTAEDVKTAMEYGVDVITLESIKHFNLVRDYCLKNKASVKVLPRLSSGAQFGMDEEELRQIISGREDYPFLDIIGIHYFTGTQKKSLDKDIEEIDYIDGLIKDLKSAYGYDCKVFEYGAGLSVPYFEGDRFDDIYGDLIRLVDHVKKLEAEYETVFEMGRFFVFSCMDYLTAVDDIKRSSDTNICLVDGGIHQLNYYGYNMAMRTPRLDIIRMGSEPEAATGSIDEDDSNWKVYGSNWKVYGSLCTFADILVRKADFGSLSLGDVLVFHNTGAYSTTEAPALFLSRKMADIYLVENETQDPRVIRQDRQSYEINI